VTEVIDASVASKWFFRETGSDDAEALLGAGAVLVAPELIVAEVVNVAWKRLRAGQIAREHAAAAAEGIGGLLDELVPMASLARRSLEIARTLDHPAYDCFYLALAERLESQLITSDDVLLRRLARTQWAKHVRRLGTRVARH
jgi:predicted nucleic acid-binding protein